MAENATLFMSYGAMKQLMGIDDIPDAKVPLWKQCVCGAGSGVAVSFVLTPVELVKCKLQAQQGGDAAFRNGGRGFSGPTETIRHVLRTEGVRGMFKGNVATLAREVPGNVAWFGVYELMCKAQMRPGQSKEDLAMPVRAARWGKGGAGGCARSAGGQASPPPLGLVSAAPRSRHSRPHAPQNFLLSGAASGVAYWSAFYPADTAKSKMQTDSRFASLSLIQSLRKVHKWVAGARAQPMGLHLTRARRRRTEGVRGLYRGWGITAARAAPSHALIFAVYEEVAKFLNR